MPEKKHWYTRACKYVVKKFKEQKLRKFREKTNAKASKELKKAIKFADLDIEPYEGFLLSYVAALLSVVVLIIIDAVLLVFIGIENFPMQLMGVMIFLLAPTALAPLFMIGWLANYPKTYAARLRVRAIGKMPEAINYLVMSMRLSPSLDRAIEFASENVEEPLGPALKKILWNIYMREYDNVEDAFLAFAYDWGDWNEDFKRSLYSIRGAVMERTDEGLRSALDKASDTVLRGTKERIEDFADSLTGPTMILFSLGILLPMIIGAMLPMASMAGFSVGLFEIVLLMNVLFPVVTLGYSYKILGKRPGTISPPQIPSTYTKTQKKAIIITAVVMGALLVLLGIYTMQFVGTGELLGFVGSLPILWGIGLPIAYYCKVTSKEQKKKRDKIKKMEEELPDAMFQLGSRISEGFPVERALDKTSETMKGTEIADTFKKISYNIQVTRSTLSDVLFGRVGILNEHPSKTIKTSMKVIVETAKKDAVSAGQTITGVSSYLRDMKKAEHDIGIRLGQVMSMMLSTGMIFAPIVMGITTALYGILYGAMAGITLPEEGAGFMGMTFGAPGGAITPAAFSLVIGIYLVLTVIVIMYFCAGITHGEDWLERKVYIGNALPVALLVYSLAFIAGQMFIGA